MRTGLLLSAVTVLTAFSPLHALALPSQGYIVYTLSDGAIYRRALNASQGVKIVNQGTSPNINPKNGSIIVYAENSGSSRHAVLTDPSGISRRIVGGTYSSMSGLYWTDRGDRFTFMYGNRQWGMMDTMGNFKQIPVPSEMVLAYQAGSQVMCSDDPRKKFEVTDPVREGGLSFPIIRGNIIQFNCQPRVQLGHIDQDRPENGIPQSSQVAPSNNGCYGTLSPNGEAYARHPGGHGSVVIVNISNKPDGTICGSDVWESEVHSSQDYSSYGIKWSNDFQWMVVRSEKDKSWNIVHLPPAGSTTLPEDPPFQVFQSYGSDQFYFGTIDMWVGPFSQINMTGFPTISSARTARADSVVVTITAPDAQSIAYYTLDGSAPSDRSTRYVQPFGVRIAADSLVVQVRAYKTGLDPSSIVRHVVTVQDVNAITRIRYYPRQGLASRMVGGIFEGTNGNKDTGLYSELYTIASAPAQGQWTEATALHNIGTAFRYVRYRASGNCNVAEIEFFRSAGTVTGTPFGTAGSWTAGMDYTKAFDGDVSTFFDYVNSTGGYTGLDLADTTVTPHITLLAPTAGAAFHLGDTVRIRWTYAPRASVRIDYSRNGGLSYNHSIDQANCLADGTGLYAWVLRASDTALVSGKAYISICDYGNSEINAFSEAFAVAPAAVVTHGQVSARWDAGTPQIQGRLITWHIAAGAQIPRVDMVAMDGRTLHPRALPGAGTVQWDLSGVSAGIYLVKFRTGSKTFSRCMVVGR